MRVDDFNFILPPERIALAPARPRDAARLLHVAGGAFHDHLVADLPGLLRAGDLLVLNDTKVIPAQLTGVRAARGEGEGVSVDVTLHKQLLQTERDAVRWRAFVRPAKRLRVGDEIVFGKNLIGAVEAREGAECVLRFDREREEFEVALSEYGVAPLPPYIARKRPATMKDREDYQTIYAEEEGSVAAPTAGLHFTDALFHRIKDAGVGIETITLHVGAGTFLPVAVEDTADHKMHAEWGEITAEQADAINAAREKGGRVISVGTTSLRLLESAADKTGKLLPFRDETDIFITPGYRFKAVDALMTNFHLPRSTLFMLVCAFAGMENMKRAYAHAIENGYRFYSYGDASLLERER
jgi:S-adenosylmethionine:tRNA ribosyltransferase-isomerase